jgi:hypothetical protein
MSAIVQNGNVYGEAPTEVFNGKYTLLGATSNTGTINLSYGISLYKFIIIYLGDGNVTFGNLLMPPAIAKQYVADDNSIALGVDTTRLGQRYYGLLTYKSDTQFYAQVSSGCSMSIYGLY